MYRELGDAHRLLRVFDRHLLNAVERGVMKLIGKKEVAELVGYHEEHIMRLAREGKFPKPVKLVDRPNAAVRFVEEEVNEWIAERLTARQGETV
jgi:predicted DNA-binding transcriptional regulator AlpA